MPRLLQRTALQDPGNPDWEALQDHLWEKRPTFYQGWMRDLYFPREDVRLSPEDWAHIQRLIVERSIPVTITSTNFGFSIGLVLWKPAVKPYPNTVAEPPEPFLNIPACALPDYERGASFDLGWDAFSPLVYSVENKALLVENEMELPKSKSAYEY